MRKTVLLAEDSAEDAEFLERMLQSLGVMNEIHVVSNGLQVLAYLKAEGIYADRNTFPFPRVLFLDLLMPRMDGWGVLAWLEHRPDILDKLLVVVYTGVLHQHRLHEAYVLGANIFVLKPPRPDELQDLLRRWPSAWDVDTGEPPALPPRASPEL